MQSGQYSCCGLCSLLAGVIWKLLHYSVASLGNNSLEIVVKLFSMGGLYSAFGLKAVSEDALVR